MNGGYFAILEIAESDAEITRDAAHNRKQTRCSSDAPVYRGGSQSSSSGVRGQSLIQDSATSPVG